MPFPRCFRWKGFFSNIKRMSGWKRKHVWTLTGHVSICLTRKVTWNIDLTLCDGSLPSYLLAEKLKGNKSYHHALCSQHDGQCSDVHKVSNYYPGQKKNHPRDSWREEHCSILWYYARWRTVNAGQSHPRLSKTFALRWSCVIRRAWYHAMEQRSSRCESRGWFFFFCTG